MKKVLKEKKGLILLILGLIISIPIILLTPSPIGVVSKDTAETLITYTGSIIGGFLTLFGVYLTIDYQRKERKENLAIQFRPLIKISDYREKIETNTNIHILYFIIKNIGRGEAKTVKIEFNKDVEVINYNGDYRNQYEINIFPSNEELEIGIKYFKDLESKAVSKEDRIISFHILYDDFYSAYTYDSFLEILIHPKTWPHTIKEVSGDIKYERIDGIE